MTPLERATHICERMEEWAEKDIPPEEWKEWVRGEIHSQIEAAETPLLDLIWQLYQDRASETAGEADDNELWTRAAQIGRRKAS